MKKFENGWQMNTYAAYHDLKVFVFYNQKDEIYTEILKSSNKPIAFYALEEDGIPSKIKTKLMRFSDFYSLLMKEGIEYLDYYFNSKDREWSWHTDAYDAFTKKKLDEYLENNKDTRYDFLNS